MGDFFKQSQQKEQNVEPEKQTDPEVAAKYLQAQNEEKKSYLNEVSNPADMNYFKNNTLLTDTGDHIDKLVSGETLAQSDHDFVHLDIEA